MLQDAVLYVHRTHIFIDTCSLLSEYSEAFWNRWIPTLRKSGQKVIIIPSVLNELMRHRDNRKDRKLARKADNVLRLLQLLEKENLVVLASVEESNYADADFEKIMACASRKQPMMLITQDRELAAKIHHLKTITPWRRVSPKAAYCSRLSRREKNRFLPGSGRVYAACSGKRRMTGHQKHAASAENHGRHTA